ncbi:hypothetical protein [Pararobbsia alpina]|uniref:Uncharacterized protein n=1 Tax=Pararobbsia alpina TaxID=621374 RepID=A0A6S7BJ33_9BURK|nr:hypothetical protein [Pararobbsia alpina]CAB3800652.1 hypothetical protein LMG28138_04878 [Pararobbsia alpina]
MDLTDIDRARLDLQENIDKEEEELGRLLSRVMSRPLEPVSERLVSVEKQVFEVDEAIRSIKEAALADLAGQVMDLEDGLRKLKGATQRNREELGAMLGGRVDEVRQDIAAIGGSHDRIQTQLTGTLEESRQQITARLAALDAQAAATAVERQMADARLVAAVAMLRTGIDQQDEALKQTAQTLSQQLLAQHQASLDALASGLADITKRVSVVQRRVRWFGIAAMLCGLATIALVLLHP